MEAWQTKTLDQFKDEECFKVIKLILTGEDRNIVNTQK